MPPANHAVTINSTRVEALDLLRLAAVAAVVLFHYAFRGAAADGLTVVSIPEIAWLAKYGYLGVDVFFVISGFVIAYSAEGRSATEFAIARIVRIYPGFVFCMTLTFLATVALGAPRFNASVGQYLANLFIVAPALKQPFMDGAYWSIVYEITFYGWSAVFIALGLFRTQRNRIVLVWLAISLANEAWLQSPLLRRLLITDESGFFAAGLLLYDAFRGRFDARLVTLLGLSSCMAVFQACHNADWLRRHYAIVLENEVIAAIAIAGILAVGAGCSVKRLPVSSNIALALGGLTYPMYLLHQHVGYMLLNHAPLLPSFILVAGVAALLLACSWLVWRFIERPAQKRLKLVLMPLARQVDPAVARCWTRAVADVFSLGRLLLPAILEPRRRSRGGA